MHTILTCYNCFYIGIKLDKLEKLYFPLQYIDLYTQKLILYHDIEWKYQYSHITKIFILIISVY